MLDGEGEDGAESPKNCIGSKVALHNKRQYFKAIIYESRKATSEVRGNKGSKRSLLNRPLDIETVSLDWTISHRSSTEHDAFYTLEKKLFENGHVLCPPIFRICGSADMMPSR